MLELPQKNEQQPKPKEVPLRQLDKQRIAKALANLATPLLPLTRIPYLIKKLIFSTSSEVAVRAFQL